MRKSIWLMIALAVTFTFVTTGFTVSISGYEPLTEQIWAVSVEADPGHTGSLGMKFEAAYGDPATKDDDDYVGNYFNIDQHAYTSSGVTKRQIDISSPESHGYLSENMTVVGMSDVRESFSMKNYKAELDTVVNWWYLF